MGGMATKRSSEPPALLGRALHDSVWLEPDAVVIDWPDWGQVSTPSLPYPNRNVIFRARLSPADAEARIAAVVDEHRRRGSGLRWIVGSDSTPADLGDRLAAAGLRRLSDTLAMWAPTTLGMPPTDGVRLERMTDGNLDAVIGVWAEGWGLGADMRPVLRRDLLRALSDPSLGVIGWLATVGDEPAGSGLVKSARGSGVLQGASVRPELRGRGVFRAVVRQRLEALRDAGTRFACVFADSESSAPILERLGFQTSAVLAYYHLEPEAITRDDLPGPDA